MFDRDLTEADLSSFNAHRLRLMEEHQRIENLVKKYRALMPTIESHWDLTANAIQHNDIQPEVIDAGINIYTCSMTDFWQGIYEPSIYEGNTLWSNKHDRRKIARVIESWEAGLKLSPVYLVKHLTKDFGLIADGKHRLTVARYIKATDFPFMVKTLDSGWVSKVFPAAKLIL